MEKLQGASTKPRHRTDLVDSEEEIGEELFLYDGNTEEVHILNGGAVLVWFLCDGTRDVAGIAQEMAATFKLPEQEVMHEVQEAIGQFQSLGLLEH